MALKDIQARLVQVGRIRLGAKTTSRGGKEIPTKLDKWRLTSHDRVRLEAAAELFGGEVKPWEDEYELYTETDELSILIVPGQVLTQHYELWGSPGQKKAISCLRRCDGETESLSGKPCLCPADPQERVELAKTGRACKPTTRLNVVLPDVPGLGCWRLDTHGFYAATEMMGTGAILERATRQGVMLPARLRLEQRESRKGGELRKYPVPVIDVDATARELRAISGDGDVRSIEHSSLRALPEGGQGTGGAAAKSSGRRTAAPLGPPGDDIIDQQAIPVPEEGPEGPPSLPPAPDPDAPLLSGAQEKLVLAKARNAGLDEEARHALILRVTGQESVSGIPKAKVDDVLNAIAGAAA